MKRRGTITSPSLILKKPREIPIECQTKMNWISRGNCKYGFHVILLTEFDLSKTKYGHTEYSNFWIRCLNLFLQSDRCVLYRSTNKSTYIYVTEIKYIRLFFVLWYEDTSSTFIVQIVSNSIMHLPKYSVLLSFNTRSHAILNWLVS